MITFLCTGCGHRLEVKDEFAGKKARCPRCAQTIPIPGTRPAPQLPPIPLVAELTAAGPSRASPADEDYSFLTPPQGPDELGGLGPYRVLKVLGAGGMGIVFVAEDIQSKRRVALKTLKPSVAADRTARQRFYREAKAAAELFHENIVSPLQIGEDRGVPFLAMPLLQGESLEDRLQRDEPLPLPEILRIGREAATGLAAAHERGLIHRDIKPANIWLEASGRVKILDFGLARVTGDDQRLTKTGTVVGTPAYMAPEQARGEMVDPRCDLFSLGCVLYRLCTGQLPFQGKDTMSVLVALASASPMPACLVNMDVPAALSDLIETLLGKKPADRPASAQDVAAALRAIAAGEVAPAALASGSRLKRSAAPSAPARTHRMVIGGLVVALLVGVTVAAIVLAVWLLR
jgi:serine/threonine protein kinase